MLSSRIFYSQFQIPVPEQQNDDHISVTLNYQNAVIDLVIITMKVGFHGQFLVSH